MYQKRDLWQLAQSDRKEIISREATLRKYKADLKPEVFSFAVVGGGGLSFLYATGGGGKGLPLRPVMSGARA